MLLIDDKDGVLAHIADIMGEATPFATHEHDANQPLA
jgi:hypothetical protein